MVPLPSVMKAYRFNSKTHELTLKDIPVPKPRPNQVLVRILAAGVCHSDVSAVFHPEAVQLEPLPDEGDTFTLGHEGAGVVVELGSAVAENYPEITQGAYVAIHDGCDTCNMCKGGRQNLCVEHPLHGLGSDGTWAEYMVLDAHAAVPVKRDISPEIVAVATDAALTPYHALKNIGKVRPGDTVLIVGCGGLGQNAVQIARNCLGAATIIACDRKEESLQVVREGGADYAVHPDQLEELVQKKRLMIDVAFDFVGVQATFDQVVGLIPSGGKIVLVGIGSHFVKVHLQVAIVREIQILGCFWGTKGELAEVLEAIGDGKIKPRVESRDFDECVRVLEDLRDGKVSGRVAIRWPYRNKL